MTSKESSIHPRQAAIRDRREVDGAASHQSSNFNFLAKSFLIPEVEILRIYMLTKRESQEMRRFGPGQSRAGHDFPKKIVYLVKERSYKIVFDEHVFLATAKKQILSLLSFLRE